MSDLQLTMLEINNKRNEYKKVGCISARMVNNTNAQASASSIPYCTLLCVETFTFVLLSEQEITSTLKVVLLYSLRQRYSSSHTTSHWPVIQVSVIRHRPKYSWTISNTDITHISNVSMAKLYPERILILQQSLLPFRIWSRFWHLRTEK
jgi:hypothetical protein